MASVLSQAWPSDLMSPGSWSDLEPRSRHWEGEGQGWQEPGLSPVSPSPSPMGRACRRPPLCPVPVLPSAGRRRPPCPRRGDRGPEAKEGLSQDSAPPPHTHTWSLAVSEGDLRVLGVRRRTANKGAPPSSVHTVRAVGMGTGSRAVSVWRAGGWRPHPGRALRLAALCPWRVSATQGLPQQLCLGPCAMGMSTPPPRPWGQDGHSGQSLIQGPTWRLGLQ